MSYLVERYWPGVTSDAVVNGTEQLTAATVALAQQGIVVRLVRTTFVPRDDYVAWLFEAESVAAVERCAAASQLTFDRLTEAFDLPTRGTGL